MPHGRHPYLQQWGPRKLGKNCNFFPIPQKLKHFGLIKGELKDFFMLSWGAKDVGTIFGGGCTPSKAMFKHAEEGYLSL